MQVTVLEGLAVPIGAPGSGKSFARSQFEAQGWKIISRARLRQQVNGSASDHSREDYITSMAEAARNTALAQRQNVFIDSTNLKTSHRAVEIEAAHEHCVAAVALLYALGDYEEMLAANDMPRAAFDKMYRQWSGVNAGKLKDEGFDQVVLCYPDTTFVSYHLTMDEYLEAVDA